MSPPPPPPSLSLLIVSLRSPMIFNHSALPLTLTLPSRGEGLAERRWSTPHRPCFNYRFSVDTRPPSPPLTTPGIITITRRWALITLTRDSRPVSALPPAAYTGGPQDQDDDVIVVVVVVVVLDEGVSVCETMS